MKTIKLTGAALNAARSIANMTEDTTHQCRALHEQFEAAVLKLHAENNEAVSVLLKVVVEASGLEVKKVHRPALDMRYLAEHNIAFLVVQDDEGEAEEPTTGNGSDKVH